MNYKKYYEKHKQTVKYAALAVILITAGGFYVSGKNKPQGEDTFVKVQESSADYGISEEDITENIYVYVCGDVLEPGVVECPAGTRMYEVVEMAGGVSECADTSSLNMAGASETVKIVPSGFRVKVKKYQEMLVLQIQRTCWLISIVQHRNSL